MWRFSVICSLFHPVKLIVYTSSHLNNKTDEIRRCSKSETIIPIGSYIVFSGSLVHGGLKTFVLSKREYPSCIRLFFTIAENNYNINVCEIIHDLTKDDFWSVECSVCIPINNVSPISIIDLHQIVKIKEDNSDGLIYGDYIPLMRIMTIKSAHYFYIHSRMTCNNWSLKISNIFLNEIIFCFKRMPK